MKRINLVGQRFGNLLVVSLAGKSKWGNLQFLCKCDCGGNNIIRSGDLRNKGIISCGCMSSTKTIGIRSTTHGFSRKHHPSSFYNRYIGLKMRCENPNSTKYYMYGARGIKCLWESFEDFRDDMYESYKLHVKEFGIKNTSIDRINNNGNYCKENCRWATLFEQGQNTRQNILREFRGEKHTTREWVKILNVDYGLFKSRIDKGWDVEKSAFTPHKEKLHTFKGKSLTIKQWAKELDVRYGLIALRLWRGWSIDKALTFMVR